MLASNFQAFKGHASLYLVTQSPRPEAMDIRLLVPHSSELNKSFVKKIFMKQPNIMKIFCVENNPFTVGPRLMLSVGWVYFSCLKIMCP